ncbi:MAG: insulinase family protein [Candidatus Aminicenantes bacterium]|nr:insulinase family protein [Candidatus Aminicenantes bacterium]
MIKLKASGVLSCLLFCLLTISSLYPQEIDGFPFQFIQYDLDNGLHVILVEDFSLPIVSVSVAYDVGILNERPGKTGISYLLENLMFQGSKNVGRMQHISLIHRIGGEWNAIPPEENTIFFQTVPSNHLELILWLESDRMNSLLLTHTRVEQAKNALIDDLEQKMNSDPYLETSLLFDRLLYPYFSYKNPILDEISDIRNLTVNDITDFYESYYRPNNAVLCICGYFNRIQVQEWIERYFSSIPQGENFSPFEPLYQKMSQTHSRTVTNPLISAPAFQIGYRISPPYSEDFYPLVLLEYLLLKGKSCRLYKRLMEKTPIAYLMEGGIEKKKDMATFKIFVVANNEIMKDRCLKAVHSEIDKLKTNLVSNEEFEKVKNMFKRDYYDQFGTSADKALFLSEYYLKRKELESTQLELSKYLSVKPIQILRAAQKYFEQESVFLDIKIK